MTLQHSHTPVAQATTLLPLDSSDATPSELLTLYWQLSEADRQKHFANTHDAAARYGIPQRTLQRWVSYGLIAAIPFGKKKYYVCLLSVEAFLQRCVTERDTD